MMVNEEDNIDQSSPEIKLWVQGPTPLELTKI